MTIPKNVGVTGLVVVADGDPSFRAFVSELVQRRSLSVVLTPTGGAALAAAREVRPALVAAAAGTVDERAADDARFTPREQEVLALLADGHDPAAIASRLVISPRTVASHIQHLLSKLGVHSQAQAVAVAYREGLVDPPLPEEPARR